MWIDCARCKCGSSCKSHCFIRSVAAALWEQHYVVYILHIPDHDMCGCYSLVINIHFVREWSSCFGLLVFIGPTMWRRHHIKSVLLHKTFMNLMVGFPIISSCWIFKNSFFFQVVFYLPFGVARRELLFHSETRNILFIYLFWRINHITNHVTGWKFSLQNISSDLCGWKSLFGRTLISQTANIVVAASTLTCKPLHLLKKKKMKKSLLSVLFICRISHYQEKHKNRANVGQSLLVALFSVFFFSSACFSLPFPFRKGRADVAVCFQRHLSAKSFKQLRRFKN